MTGYAQFRKEFLNTAGFAVDGLENDEFEFSDLLNLKP
jgi:enoyl-[acyl-carrier protein] reductase/trans-2-enoyl-CoA reductase (NAD+)